MSSITPERTTYSNPLEREMTESECAVVEVHNQPVNDNYSVSSEWVNCMKGKKATKHYERERHMEKVPPSLLKSEKGPGNSAWYEPAVVSLGPYHHNRPGLAQAEKYKLITLEEYHSNTGETINSLYNRVFEVVHDARKCYIDGSTDAYSDQEFNKMMLRDACFILFFIECISCGNIKLMLTNEYLGAIEFSNITRDLFLLENQVAFVVLEVLLKLKFPEDKGENILNKFFNYLNYGEVVIRDKKVLGNNKPLHLLELYRSYFISLPTSHSLRATKMSQTQNKEKDLDEDEGYNYVKGSRSFASVTGLKARWIFLIESTDDLDIKFNFGRCYGEFKLVRRAVSSYTKVIYMNMIAYEMCPHNPNDLRISVYIRVMKSLIIQGDDVKELRRNNILLHSLGSDEEVAKMYAEIEVPAVNLYIFNQIRLAIDQLHDSKYKTWVAELITDYFGSPWKALGLLVATCVLVTSFVQTYFTIKPRDSITPMQIS